MFRFGLTVLSLKILILNILYYISLNSPEILLLFWTLVLEIYYCGNFATFLDSSTGDLLLRKFCYFFVPLYWSSIIAEILLLFWTLVLEFYYCGNFATFLDPCIGVLLLRKFCYFFVPLYWSSIIAEILLLV